MTPISGTVRSDSYVLGQASLRGHEQVVFFHYPEVGLKAIVAVHNTVLGPALGGCRMRLYADEAEALDDVMRLSEGMTYKSALAGLNLGGGKSCVIADPGLREGRRELFLKLGACVHSLGGRYITAEDMGTTVKDLSIMKKVTPFAAGHLREEGGSGDPSPWTARGVFVGMRAACERAFGSPDLTGKSVLVEGVGNVGGHLVEQLVRAGARVVVSDVRRSAVEDARRVYNVEAVPPDGCHLVPCDVYAPCAVGQTVNPRTAPELRCKVVCGGANNQISDPSVHQVLRDRGILYCPDFVVNSGGVTSIAAEFIPGGWSEPWVRQKVEGVAATTTRVLDEAEKTGEFAEVTAVRLAKARIAEAEGRVSRSE